MRIFFIWVFLLSCSISHLESCMLSAVLFKDLCLSEEVPFIFLLSHSGMWTFKHKANFFTSITLDMLSQLYPQITVLEIRLLFFIYLFSTYAWTFYFGFEFKASQPILWKNSTQPKVLFFFEICKTATRNLFNSLQEQQSCCSYRPCCLWVWFWRDEITGVWRAVYLHIT